METQADDGLRLHIGEVREPEKFRHAVLYLLHAMGPLTREHLTYLLYQADIGHMEQHRTSITGATYYKGVPQAGGEVRR